MIIRNKRPLPNMVDKTIKVSVFRSVGISLPLSIQLQLSYLDEAMWTARSTSGRFCVKFFWPAPASENDARVQPKKRKRRAKASS